MVTKNLLKTSLKIKIKENGRRILKPTLIKRVKKKMVERYMEGMNTFEKKRKKQENN